MKFHETDQKRTNRFSLSAIGFAGNFTKVKICILIEILKNHLDEASI